MTTVTFRPGTDPIRRQVQGAKPRRAGRGASAGRRAAFGHHDQKQSPTLTLVVHLFSPGGKYDSLYMRNYATLKVKDELAPARRRPDPDFRLR